MCFGCIKTQRQKTGLCGLKELCVSVPGFDGRNRDTGGNLSKRFVEQLATDLKMDLVICKMQDTQPRNTA